MRLISANDIVGHISRWAVQQHPYRRPEGLFDFVQDVASKCSSLFKDGCASLPMQWFSSYRDVLRWLHELDGHPTLTAWNTPKSGHNRYTVGSSRYDGPAPEDDFIDIGALWMNVARGLWDDAAEFEKPPATAGGSPLTSPERP